MPTVTETFDTAEDGTPLTWKVLMPTDGSSGPWNVVLTEHGGAFKQNIVNPEQQNCVTDLAAAGYIAIWPQYRLAPPGSIPGQISLGHYPDCYNDTKRAALKAVTPDVGSVLHGNVTGKYAVVGGSAGGSLAMLLCVDTVTQVSPVAWVSANRAEGGVSLSGALAFDDTVSSDPNYVTFQRDVTNFCNVAYPPDAAGYVTLAADSPYTLITSAAKPMLLYNGTTENMPKNQLALGVAALDAAGVTNYIAVLDANPATASDHSWARYPSVKTQLLAFVASLFAGGPPPVPIQSVQRGVSALIQPSTPVPAAVISSPIEIVTLAEPWYEVQPTPITFDFSYFEGEITRTLAGDLNKKFILEVQTGRGSAYFGGLNTKPTWLYTLLRTPSTIHVNSHGTTTAASATVSVTGATFVGGDLYKRIFISTVVNGVWTQVTPDTTYIGVVTDSTHIGLSSTTGSNTPVGALVSVAGTACVEMWPDDSHIAPDSHYISPGVTYSWDESLHETITIPVPWNSVLQSRRNALYTAMGAWYDALAPNMQNAILGIRIAYANARTDDFNLPDSDTIESPTYTRTQVQRWLDATGSGGAGYTTQPMIDMAVTTTAVSPSFSDGVVASTTTLTSISAGFSAADVGKTVTGSGIGPGNTNVIASVVAATDFNGATATLQTATSNGAKTFVIVNRVSGLFDVVQAALPNLFCSYSIGQINELDAVAAAAAGDSDVADFLAKTVNGFIQTKYQPNIVTQFDTFTAISTLAPPAAMTSLGLLYTIALSGAPVAGRALYKVSGDSGLHMNGGTRDDHDYTGSPPIPQLSDDDILSRSGARVSSYLGYYYEIYSNDVAGLPDATLFIDNLLRGTVVTIPLGDILPPSLHITPVNYRDDVLYQIAALLNVDLSKGLVPARVKIWANYVNRWLAYGWRLYRWPELTQTEERAFAPIWNATDQFSSADVKVYWTGQLDSDGVTVIDYGYYSVASMPPIGVIPTDTNFYTPYTLTAQDYYIPNLQRCRQRLGDIYGAFPSDPTLGPLGYAPQSLNWRRSGRGLEIFGSGQTVFLQYRVLPYKFTSDQWVSTTIYNPGDLVMYNGDGQVYRALKRILAVIPGTDTSSWAYVPFPSYFANFCVYMAAADDSDDVKAAGEFRDMANDFITREMDINWVQDSTTTYNFGGSVTGIRVPAGTTSFLWSVVPPYTAAAPGSTTISSVCLNEWGDPIA